MNFLPTNKKEIKERNIKQVDFVVVTGDAYVDHPSFGTSLIARYLESFGYSCAILAQPNVKDDNSIKKCGIPRLGFLVGSGNIDSMVNNYYVSKKKRRQDEYSVNNKGGKRPDYATIEYCKLIRRVYNDVPIVIGGIEASLRRFAHYDYWQDTILPSVLLSSTADLLVYSMGEKAIVEIADYLNSGLDIKDITFIKGTCYKSKSLDNLPDYVLMNSVSDIKKDSKKYSENYLKQYNNNDNQSATTLVEPYNEEYVIANIPQPVLSQSELDHLYDLPFTYESYDEYMGLGKVSALNEVKFSISANRGCNGGCNFCAITYHQGRQVSMRSTESCVAEAKKMMTLKDWKGYIHDVGGPTANFNDDMCDKLNNYGSCSEKSCFGFHSCNNLKVSHEKYFDILEKVREIDGIKKVFVRSGIRYDYMLKDDDKYLEELVKYHVSGQLRLAPEHVSDNVLKVMGKPSVKLYDKFVDKFNKVTKNLNKEQYVLPYLMSSHPGSTLDDALQLALYLKKINYQPKQVQDFYPTPSTMSTLMYYTNTNPLDNNKKIFVAKSENDKAIQRAFLQYKDPKNRKLVISGLKQLHRDDLIKGPKGLL
ncbi:YgiQ family radical SAM protein [Mycoplasma sp. P36-A1]|uniref:YgiQ family radical SAM protein n=1 Tax=Mycoplasma sp. P36-A1 TaxID=3252900 RepID=UPI003C2D7546